MSSRSSFRDPRAIRALDSLIGFLFTLALAAGVIGLLFLFSPQVQGQTISWEQIRNPHLLRGTFAAKPTCNGERNGWVYIATDLTAGANTYVCLNGTGWVQQGVGVFGPQTNGAVFWNGTGLQTTATGGSGSLCLISTNGGPPSFQACSGAGSLNWSGVTSGTNTNTLLMGTGGSLSVSGAGTINANKLGGVLLSSLGTGILKNTTGTGTPSLAAAADVISLWGGSCTISTVLYGDGQCRPSGGGTVIGTPNQIDVTGSTISIDPVLQLPGTLLGSVVDSTQGGANDRSAYVLNYTSNGLVTPGQFSNDTNLRVGMTLNGNTWNDSDATGKISALPSVVTLVKTGQGQGVGSSTFIWNYGMGDALLESRHLICSGGTNANGDEGCEFSSNQIEQPASTPSTTITTAHPPSACNTTVAGSPIVPSSTAQSVQVVSSTGCNGNWVVASPSNYAGSNPREEGVLITASADSTHITGIFKEAHAVGQAIVGTNALDLASASTWGQMRYVRNKSATPYTVGTVASISGLTFNNAGGANWTGLAGQCINLTNDTVGGIDDVFGIVSTSAGSLTIARYNQAGGQYSGNGVGSGGYAIYPCSRAVAISGSTVVLEQNSFTWSNGNTVDSPISSDQVWEGNRIRFAATVPSTSVGHGFSVTNAGSVTGTAGFFLGNTGTTGHWTYGLYLADQTNTPIYMDSLSTSGFSLQMKTNATGDSKSFRWLADTFADGLDLGFRQDLGTHGLLQITQEGVGLNWMDFSGAGNAHSWAWPSASGTICLTTTCGGGPGGPTNSLQRNNGSGGFTGAAILSFDGTTLTSPVIAITNGGGFASTLDPGSITANQVVNFPNASGLLALSNGIPANNDCVKYVVVGGVITLTTTGAPCGTAGGYNTIQDNGTGVAQEPTVNFISGTNATVSCVDNPGSSKTDCTISASSGAGSRLDQITAATGANSINSADNAQVWNWSISTASKIGMVFGENSASTGSGSILLDIQTLATSTAIPFRATAQGTSNGVELTTGGVLHPIGSGHINADQVNGSSVSGTNGDLVTFGSSNVLADSGILATNIVRKDSANTGTSSFTLNMSASQTITGFRLPLDNIPTPPTADGVLSASTVTHGLLFGSNNANTFAIAVASSGGASTGTNCASTNQVLSAIFAAAAPNCITITSSFVDSTITRNNSTNTGTSGMSINLSASTVTNGFRVPVQAGLTSGASGTIGYDSTGNNLHVWAGGADAIALALTGSPANNDCAKFSVSGSTILVTTAGAPCGSGGGSPVTSVSLNLPASTFATGTSVVGTAWTLNGTFLTQSANTALLGPTTGAASTPGWRQFVAADITPAGTLTNNISGTAAGITGKSFSGPGTVIATTITPLVANDCIKADALGNLVDAGAPCGGGGGSSAFSAITSGSNTSATMQVGTGASLTPTGSGVIISSTIQGVVNARAPLGAGGCGLAMNGSTDDGPALQTCINNLAATGGTIDLGNGQLAIATTVTWTANNVRLRGSSGVSQMDLNSPMTGLNTRIACSATPCFKWLGATAAGSPYNQNFIYGPAITDLVADGGGGASAMFLQSVDAVSSLLENVTLRNFSGDYAVHYTSDVSKTACSSRLNTVHNVWIGTNNGTNASASGMRFGDSSALHEVCSNTISNLYVGVSERPGTHQLFLDYTDTDQLSNIWLNGAGSTIKAVSGISVSAGVATVTATGHGLTPGSTDGVFIIGGCSIATTGIADCGGTQIPQITGSFQATYVDANHFTFPVRGTLANGSYFAALVGGTSLQVGPISSGTLSSIYTLNGVSGVSSTTGPIYLSGWNWLERCGYTPTCSADTLNSPYAQLTNGIVASDTIGGIRQGGTQIPGKIQVQANFTNSTDAGSAGIAISTTFTNPHAGSVSGLRVDVADPTTDTSSGIGVYDNGNSDALFIQAKGFDAGATNPSGVNVQMNLKQGSSLPSCAAGGSLCQNNSLYAGRGTQIWDYTFVSTNSLPFYVSNRVGGVNPLARFDNVGPGPAYIQMLSPSGQEAGVQFVDNATVVWSLKKNTTSPNIFALTDVVNSRIILSATAGGSSRLKADNGLLLPNVSGALQIQNSAGTPVNAMSVSGGSAVEITNFGAGTGVAGSNHFEWFTSAGLIATLSNSGQFNTQGPIGPRRYTAAGMPTCNGTTVSTLIAVTDYNPVPSWGVTVLTTDGGGSHQILAHCNSASWTLVAQ